MTTNEFSKAATGVIATVGSTAHQIIDAYRAGGERINEAFTQRWNAALKESLSEPQVRRTMEEIQQARLIMADPAALGTFVQREVAKWGAVVRENNIRAD